MRAIAVWCAVISSSCSVGYVGQSCPSQVKDISTEGSGRECKAPGYFKGVKKAGDSCNASSECEPVCCGCSNGNGVAWAAACEKGRCVDKDEACCRFDAHSDICRRGPSSSYFHTCETAADCSPGMECLVRFQVTATSSTFGTECELNQRICTRRCSSDSQCTAFDGACTGSDACGGPKNLCDDT